MKNIIATVFTKENAVKLAVGGVAVVATIIAIAVFPTASVDSNIAAEETPDTNI